MHQERLVGYWMQVHGLLIDRNNFAFLHAEGKVEVRREQLIISVRAPKITGSESFLHASGDLFTYNDKTVRRTSSHVTLLK